MGFVRGRSRRRKASAVLPRLFADAEALEDAVGDILADDAAGGLAKGFHSGLHVDEHRVGSHAEAKRRAGGLNRGAGFCNGVGLPGVRQNRAVAGRFVVKDHVECLLEQIKARLLCAADGDDVGKGKLAGVNDAGKVLLV